MSDSLLGGLLALPGGLVLYWVLLWMAEGKSDIAFPVIVGWCLFSAFEAPRLAHLLRQRRDDNQRFWRLCFASSCKVGGLLGLGIGVAAALQSGPGNWQPWFGYLASEVVFTTGWGLLAAAGLFFCLVGGPFWGWGLRKWSTARHERAHGANLPG